MGKPAAVTAPVPLSCDTIGDQDNGIARPIVDAEIQKALDDLIDRGEEDGKERQVAIVLTMGFHNGMVYSNVAAQAKLPARRSKNTAGKIRMKAKGQHEFIFMADDRDNPDQPTFEAPDEA